MVRIQRGTCLLIAEVRITLLVCGGLIILKQVWFGL